MILNKNIHKVNILGTEYTVVFDSNSKNPKLEYKDGYVDTSVKRIVIRDYFEDSVDNLEDLEEFQAKVLRHEIIHAFLHESGLDAQSPWAVNEEMVDWFAIQFYKITNAIDLFVIDEVIL